MKGARLGKNLKFAPMGARRPPYPQAGISDT
jgi:hypothetical protein